MLVNLLSDSVIVACFKHAPNRHADYILSLHAFSK